MLALTCACTTSGKPLWLEYALHECESTTEKSQLETREFQAKIVDIENSALVLRSILDMLQDDGYSTKNLDFNAGYFNAVKETSRRINVYGKVMHTFKDYYEVTINVSKYGKETKIRASFKYKCILEGGSSFGHKWDERELANCPVEDPQFYQDFFNKVDKAIFIENQKL
jgi:hypothetical protein